MKKIILISALILLVTNILFGAILSCYDGFNMAVSSSVILLTALTLYIVKSIRLKDAFKVSLTLLFALSGVIEFFISLFISSRFSDNWGIMVIIALLILQGLILLLTNTVSTKIR